MRKLFDSGVAFTIVAVICFVAGLVSENRGVFIGVGAFWLVMAIIVRGKNSKRSSNAKREQD